METSDCNEQYKDRQYHLAIEEVVNIKRVHVLIDGTCDPKGVIINMCVLPVSGVDINVL